MKKKVTIRKQKIGENLLYSAVWVAVYLIPIMNSKLMSEVHINFTNVFIAWIKITPFFLIFLVNNLLLSQLLILRKRYLTYIFTMLPLISITFALVEVYERSDIYFAVADTVRDIVPHRAALTDLAWYWNILLGLFMCGMNAGIKMMYKSMQDDEDMEILRHQRVQAEMYYLRHQINPHFFMNTLNNIHALIDIDAESAKQCVIELSNMMRYVVYDSGSEHISMRRDMTFIENYIELMRIRYTQDIDIRFSYTKNLSPAVAVPPLIFIVFVENAFKHGISYNRPSYIHIDIAYSAAEGMVTARFENSLHNDNRAGKTVGIGLDNVRKRLDLIYGSRYELGIFEQPDEKYCITLKIPTLTKNDKVSGN